MSIRKVTFAFDEYYHVYNRGNSKQKIFHDKQDYEHFVLLLLILNNDKNLELRNLSKDFLVDLNNVNSLVSIGAYVLMPNHFHILLTEKIDGGISKFMQKVSTAYVMYYNKKYTRTGSLFEGKFKSQHLDTDNYLKYIFSYIHLNPIKLIDKNWKEEGIKNKSTTLIYLEGYQYSSYMDYLGIERLQNKILNKFDFPDYFPSTKLFSKEVFTWLSFKDSY
ncbi:hypothetical protein A3J61_02095 [Candidatus Nomurabacteria bacterium RIFCSPHIGHO2_02_FULL_38_15]|uniref:Transposase IS200-like domain-containing protein n=1 Tax=Candidatus Nomurabacteria bacterium RIFCSPHIGHO2_02_FULL_38_15 TaxID=1801752 RepID=A0A1F6VRD2_9BACT|nr:MAG: hypothetical protein A3J61_02095 [Candidatus Nomurabacteria bacterium RIFCSPHIGHO2_02_FULL_38_15]